MNHCLENYRKLMRETLVNIIRKKLTFGMQLSQPSLYPQTRGTRILMTWITKLDAMQFTISCNHETSNKTFTAKNMYIINAEKHGCQVKFTNLYHVDVIILTTTIFNINIIIHVLYDMESQGLIGHVTQD